jgi:hypothetical protein
MAGRKGRSGRLPGSLSWMKNPTALAGHHLNGLIEKWLAGMPIQTGPDSWLVQPIYRRHTVPPRIKQALAVMAIRHVMELCPHLRRPSIAQVLAWSRRQAPSATLRHAARSKPRDEREAAHRVRKYLDHLIEIETAARKK